MLYMFDFVGKVLQNLEGKTTYPDIWQVRLIRFDIEQQQREENKPFQVYYGISNSVQDIKGNPGLRGCFYLTNLRIYWHAIPEKNLNLSVGIDSIHNITIKSFPSQTHNIIKHMLIVKAQNQNLTRYQFRFCSILQSDLQLFQKVNLIHKQSQNTKFMRNIDTKVKQIDQEYIGLKGQEIKSKFENLFYVENQQVVAVNIYLTNIRISIIQKNSTTGINYGIPWMCVKEIEKEEFNKWPAIKITAKGILRFTQMMIYGKSQVFQLFLDQFRSFCEVYCKNPILGIELQSGKIADKQQFQVQKQFEEIQGTNVNIKRNKNPYSIQQQQGDLSNTQFNQQLGIMMERMPPGMNRAQLWEILKN